MSIRNLFLLFTISLIFLLAALGLWQGADSYAKVQAVSWLEKSNQLVNSVQRASSEIAVERGMAANLLAQIERQPKNAKKIEKYWSLLQTQQRLVDGYLDHLAQTMDELILLSPSVPLERYQELFYNQVDYLIAQRVLVANSYRLKQSAISSQAWISNVSAMIEVLHNIAGVSLHPIEGNVYSYASHPIIQDVLFVLGEYLGRQRALIVSALSKNQSLSPQELLLIENYHSVVEQNKQRVYSYFNELGISDTVTQELQDLEQQYQRYEVLKNQIIERSQRQASYSISVDEWFSQATATIYAAQKISYELKYRFEKRINELRDNARQAQRLLTLISLVLIFGFTFALYFLNRKVLKPIEQLQSAAKEIGHGNLNQPFILTGKNEVALLAQAFEQMRLQLITDAQTRLEHEQERIKLYAAINQSMAAVIIIDLNERIDYVNDTFVEVTGLAKEQLLNQPASLWYEHLSEKPSGKKILQQVRNGHAWSGELLHKKQNGELYWSLSSISAVHNEQGEMTHIIDIHMDISEHKKVVQRLEHVSYYDQTTLLPNRAYLARYFAEYRSAQPEESTLTLFAFSIGKLKVINDNFGWQVGDKALKEIGKILRKHSLNGEIVAHLEGGKFCLLSPMASNQKIAEGRVSKILKQLSLPLSLHDLQLKPNAGISFATCATHSFDKLLKDANIALHNAERSSTDNYCFYQPELDHAAQQRLALEQKLQQAIINQEITVHYQPKVRIMDNKIIAVEALARWFEPEQGHSIPPDKFIPIAERSGLIYALGLAIFEQVCAQLVEWNRQGHTELMVAVNVSVEQLKQPSFINDIEHCLNRYQLSAGQIELEITESVFMENPQQAMEILAYLKQLGFKLAIDDFGTGYSSLSYLSMMPVDYLKIDKSFVSLVTEDSASAAIATSIIALGHRMGLEVIAEGVEHRSQLNYLAQHRCDYMQGFLYSKPLPAAAMSLLLNAEVTAAKAI